MIMYKYICFLKYIDYLRHICNLFLIKFCYLVLLLSLLLGAKILSR